MFAMQEIEIDENGELRYVDDSSGLNLELSMV